MLDEFVTINRGTAGGGRGASNMLEFFARALLEEVMPQVEKAYRVSKDRTQRAISGRRKSR